MREGQPPAYIYKHDIFCPSCVKGMFRPEGMGDEFYTDSSTECVLRTAARLRKPQICYVNPATYDADEFPKAEFWLEYRECCTSCTNQL